MASVLCLKHFISVGDTTQVLSEFVAWEGEKLTSTSLQQSV